MRRLLPLLLLAACASPAPKPAATPTTPAPPGSTVLAKIRVGGEPCGVAAAAGAVWVTDARGARLVRVAGGRVTGTTKVDATPCEIATGFGALWVVTQSGRLDRVDPRTGRVTARIPVGQTSYEAVAAFGHVWVTNRDGNSVSKVDPRTNRVVATIATPFVNAGGIAATKDALWVGNDAGGDTTLRRLDPRTHALTKVTAGTRPAFVAVAGETVFVANEQDGTVTRLDATGRALGTVAAGRSPVNLAVVGGDVWVPDDQGNVLTRIDARTGAVTETLPVGAGPAVVAADGADVLVTCLGEGTVWRVRPAPR
ncbi:MAG TPA: YncE family protein [Mycobacteriales bacterium]|jgi:YVTN family beta-propeller protein|nr:YncE family protein [Mycobacteriales bacterium]